MIAPTQPVPTLCRPSLDRLRSSVSQLNRALACASRSPEHFDRRPWPYLLSEGVSLTVRIEQLDDPQQLQLVQTKVDRIRRWLLRCSADVSYLLVPVEQVQHELEQLRRNGFQAPQADNRPPSMDFASV